MARNGSGVYSLPPGSTITNGDTSDATDLNTPLADLETDANTARPIVAGGTGATSASNARTNLGLAIGTDVQAYDAGLQSISGLTTAADKMIYTTASDTYAITDLTSAGRAILDDADASAQRTTLGLGSSAEADLIDDDTMATATSANVASAESVKAYVDNNAAITTVETPVTTTGGTTVDFTGIPASVTNIVIQFAGTNLSGTDNILVQIGDSGGFETSGYASASTVAATAVTSSSGFIIQAASGTNECSGQMQITSFGSNTWTSQHGIYRSVGNSVEGGGAKTLSGTLTQVRVTVTGSNTFDTSNISIAYW